MADDRGLRCFDSFPYAERLNQRLWRKGRELPGWYPSLDQIFPMIVCRVLPVGGLVRPATYCRVLGHAAGVNRPAAWMGGYQACLMMDQTGWPVFRVERLFIPPEPEFPLEEILERLLADGQKIAKGIGVSSFQVVLLEVPDGSLPGFPAVCSPFGPLSDSRLGGPLADLGFSPLADLGYFRTAVAARGDSPAGHQGAGDGVESRTFHWGDADQALYQQLWAEHCARHRDDFHFLASRLHPLDPWLQHHMEPAESLSRIQFIGRTGQVEGFVSWYPDVYPQLLRGEAIGPQVRLQLGEVDPQTVTSAKVLKCLAPRSSQDEEADLLAAGIRWAAGVAVAAHPRLEWIEAGPVAGTNQPLLGVLEQEGFQRFGSLKILQRHLSRFRD